MPLSRCKETQQSQGEEHEDSKNREEVDSAREAEGIAADRECSSGAATRMEEDENDE
jgi:hypothetical protein